MACGAVSVVVVVDPLAAIEADVLPQIFPDCLIPLKAHFVRDLESRVELPKHHRRNVLRAVRSVDVQVCEEPAAHLDEWLALYSGLASRHGLSGTRAFSREAFAAQLAVPGLIALRAGRDGVTVAMSLWYESGMNAYYHLGASNALGYEVGASYALFDRAFEVLSNMGVRRVHLGGVPQSGSDGLHRFKSGWATEQRVAWLGGRVLDEAAYARLAASHPDTSWFPSYRHSEPDFAPSAQTSTSGTP
jgi:hypothetical protein